MTTKISNTPFTLDRYRRLHYLGNPIFALERVTVNGEFGLSPDQALKVAELITNLLNENHARNNPEEKVKTELDKHLDMMDALEVRLTKRG
jgi:hypothetical protein